MAHREGTYSRLYDMVELRLANEGRSMPITRDAFELAAEMPPGVLDVFIAVQANNYTFFQIAYLCLLCALPNESTYEVWRVFFESMSSSQFRAKTLRLILNWCSTCNREAKIVNGEEYVEP